MTMSSSVSRLRGVLRSPVVALAAALALAAFAGAAPVQAQSPDSESETGQIVGQVLDLESGEPIPGAQILLNGQSAGPLAGVSGRFQMRDVPVGVHALTVSYLGYRTHRVDSVEVDAGATTRLAVRMERAAVEVEGITVSARREGGTAASALNAQRTAVGVTNAISSEQIARSPDGDAAAAVKRVSGVTVQEGKYVFVRGLGERYTTASLNGARIPSPDPERKVVPLDLFPSGLLEAISTQKSFTPDRPGDFSGGAVDIRTPEFPLRPVYSFSMSSGFRPGVTGNPVLVAPAEGTEWLAFGTEPRELPDAAANYSGTSSRGDEVNRVVNSFRNVWTPREETGRLPVSLGGSVGGSTEIADRTLGYIGSFTYSNSQTARLDERRARVGTGNTEIDRYDGESGSSSVLWGGIANVGLLLGNHTEIHLNNSYNRSADNEARREAGMDENTRANVQIDRLRYVERSVRSNQLRAEHQLTANHALAWSLSNSAVNRSEPDRSEFVTWLDPETPVWFNDFEGAVRTFGSLDESSSEARLDYTLTLPRSGGAAHRIRMGGLMRETDRAATSQGFRIQAFTWSPSDPRWQRPPEEFFDGRYSEEGDDDFLLSRELSGGSYDAFDRQSAAYAMGELQLGSNHQLVGGVRIENSRIEVDSENQLGQEERVERDDTDLLPSIALNLGIAENHQLRLSAARTLARPEYREMAPITYREVLGGDQVIGNRELIHTLIDNVDARWEWYPSGDEIVSLGIFAKRFRNPIEQRYLARSGTNTRTFENAESALNYGVEAEVRKHMGGLHPALNPLGLFVNATVMRSEVRTGSEDDTERPMVGQAPWVVNTGVTWSPPNAGTSATLLYNVVGERIVNARASGSTVEDVTERSRHLLDLSIRFPLLGGASGKIDVSNLLDSPYEVVQGPIVREYHRTGRQVSVGVSWQWR